MNSGVLSENKMNGSITAKEICQKYDDVDDAMKEIENEIYRRVDLFAGWLHDKKFSEEEINTYATNILCSEMVITVHEPPYMFLGDAKDDIPEDKNEIYNGESCGFLFKYHVFLDAIRETQVDENYIKALKLYFVFLSDNKFIKKIPRVVDEVFGKEDIYLRRLKEYRECDPDDEGCMDWFGKWCDAVFEI